MSRQGGREFLLPNHLQSSVFAKLLIARNHGKIITESRRDNQAIERIFVMQGQIEEPLGVLLTKWV